MSRCDLIFSEGPVMCDHSIEFSPCHARSLHALQAVAWRNLGASQACYDGHCSLHVLGKVMTRGMFAHAFGRLVRLCFMYFLMYLVLFITYAMGLHCLFGWPPTVYEQGIHPHPGPYHAHISCSV